MPSGGQTTQCRRWRGATNCFYSSFSFLYEMKGLCFGKLASGFFWESTKPMCKRHFCSLRSSIPFPSPDWRKDTPLVVEWRSFFFPFSKVGLAWGWFMTGRRSTRPTGPEASGPPVGWFVCSFMFWVSQQAWPGPAGRLAGAESSSLSARRYPNPIKRAGGQCMIFSPHKKRRSVPTRLKAVNHRPRRYRGRKFSKECG